MAKVYFQQGQLAVTNEFVKARNRSIQLSTLESVAITRRLFFFALALGGGLLGLGLAFGDLLRPYEIAVMTAIGGGALWLAWNVGTLTIYSKLTGAKGWAVTGWMGPLRAMRAAVENALEETRPYRK